MYTEYQQKGLDQLREGKQCDHCANKALIMYATSCHGYFFLCDSCNESYQKYIKEIDNA